MFYCSALSLVRATFRFQVFNQLSNVKSASISAPDSKIRLTPRSKIACLSQGVNPELLRRRDKSSFSVPGVDPEIQRLMHEAYDRRRIELMGVACAERKKIIEIRETKDGQNASASNEKSHTYLTPADILAREEHVTSTLIETEKQRLEKMKERQKKKLLQKIKYEVYMQEAETAMREKEQINAKLAEAESKEREDRKRKEAEGRRIQEISRQAEEQEVEERKRQLAQKDYEREQNISKQREDQRIANKMRARILDDERREKQQKQRNETDRKINDIRIEILKKGTERELKDRQHALKVEARRNVEKAASAHRRKEILKRQSANKDAALCAEEKRKVGVK